MKPARFDYLLPETLEEALDLKASLGYDASVMAGGQSLVPMLSMRLARPPAIIDIRLLDELRGIRLADGELIVGALTTQRELEVSVLAHLHCPLLRVAQRFIAHPPIRSRGTIGGSIAHADPAAELPAVLALLGGRVEIDGPAGVRMVDADEFFLFHFTTALEPEELVVSVRFPTLRSEDRFAFTEFSRRSGDYPIVGAGAVIHEDGVRLVFAAVGPRPVVVDSDDPAEWLAAIEPSDDIHATAAYRRELTTTLGARALDLARAHPE